MSFNQSRSDKSDNHYRKTGRSGSFNQQRGSSGTYVKGSGGGPAPSPGITSGSTQSSNRSSKRFNNPHGGQSRVNPPPVNSAESNSASTGRTIPNDAHLQESPGASHAPVANAAAKSSVQKSTRVVPKAPTPRPTTMSSDTADPATPTKAPEDSSKPFAFQFGSISPGCINGISVPARTSSAPPNLDEQKRDQARHNSFRPVPPLPTPPRHLPSRNDGGVTDQSSAGEAHSVNKVKKEEQVSALPPFSQMQKPSVAMTGISMAMPYHYQSQAPVQFGGPNPQMQSQGMPAASLPMPIPMGNVAQVQQHGFFQGLQPLPIHPPGIMHQGQNLSFSSQMSPQMPHQLGNMGINLNPQYSQQQVSAPRKTTTVKITHPETRKEVRLDFDKRADSQSDGTSSSARSYPSVSSQSQPVQSLATSHPLNYYPSSTYSGSSLLFSRPSSVPLSSGHITPNSQQPRFSYPVNQGPQNAGFNNQISFPVNKIGATVPGHGDSPNLEHSRDVQKVISPTTSGPIHASIKPSGSSGIKTSESPSSFGVSIDAGSTASQKGSDNFSETSSHQSKSSSDSFVPRSLPKQPAAGSAEKLASTPLMPSSASMSENSASELSNNEGRRKESLSRSNSMKDNHKKTGKIGESLHQVPVQSPALVNVPPQVVDSVMPDHEVSDTVENKTKPCAAMTSEDISSKPEASSVTVNSGIVPDAEEINIDPSAEGFVCISAEGVDASAVDSLNNQKHDKQEESSQQDKLVKMNILEVANEKERSSEVFEQKGDDNGTKFKQTEQDAAKESEDVRQRLELQDESTDCRSLCDRTGDNLGVSTSNDLDSRDITLDRNDSTVSNESISANSAASDKNSSDLLEATSKHSKDSPENAESGSVSLPTSVNKDRPILEPNKLKTTIKGKKKRKEILQKADAAGSTSDLYNAYKRPEERKEVVSTESKENTSPGSLKQLPNEAAQSDAMATEKGGHDKAEPDDWEDAADISSPKLEVLDKTHLVSDGSELTAKKYSRDFLLKFEEQCVDLPEGLITDDIAELLTNSNITGSHIERDSHLSAGRIMDRPGGMSRMDRRGSGHFEEDRWSKVPGPFNSGRDIRMDGFGGNAGFRPGQGGNFGVLRNPRAQAPMQYVGGILSGPMQSMGNQGVMPKNSPDGERWQRATNIQQRGLIPSPQTPLQMMHKAEKKYEVGKVTDEEQAKQRQLKAILNKLTPQNFERLFEQVKAVNIDTAVTLTGVISQIFEKALMEPTFCEMYANFCSHLAAELPDFSEDNEKITFKRLLLNKCQEEFERVKESKKKLIRMMRVKSSSLMQRGKRNELRPEDAC
ncbi:hypothetical protein K1719_024210 [Acacia pycnantha]|nr:hypothetical protein K1719_024210 [Acacia pycnantha]